MSSILFHTSKVFAAERFVNAFLDNDPTYNVYVAFSDAGDWSPDPQVPDTPVDALSEEGTFWAGLLGVVKVNDVDTDIVTPKVVWTSGTAYTVYDSTTGVIADWDNPTHYVINSENRVYKCTTAGGGNSTFEPTGAADVDFTGSDGYYWTYLYDASYDYSLLTTSWMPVPTAHVYTLGAHRILVRKEIPDNTNSGGILPATGSYNQVGIVVNPQKGDDSGNFTAAYGVPGATSTTVSTTLAVGSVLVLDNRPPITRNNSQSEIAYMLFSF